MTSSSDPFFVMSVETQFVNPEPGIIVNAFLRLNLFFSTFITLNSLDNSPLILVNDILDSTVFVFVRAIILDMNFKA